MNIHELPTVTMDKQPVSVIRRTSLAAPAVQALRKKSTGITSNPSIHQDLDEYLNNVANESDDDDYEATSPDSAHNVLETYGGEMPPMNKRLLQQIEELKTPPMSAKRASWLRESQVARDAVSAATEFLRVRYGLGTDDGVLSAEVGGVMLPPLPPRGGNLVSRPISGESKPPSATGPTVEVTSSPPPRLPAIAGSSPAAGARTDSGGWALSDFKPSSYFGLPHHAENQEATDPSKSPSVLARSTTFLSGKYRTVSDMTHPAARRHEAAMSARKHRVSPPLSRLTLGSAGGRGATSAGPSPLPKPSPRRSISRTASLLERINKSDMVGNISGRYSRIASQEDLSHLDPLPRKSVREDPQDIEPEESASVPVVGHGSSNLTIWERLRQKHGPGSRDKFKAVAKVIQMNMRWQKDQLSRVDDSKNTAFVVNLTKSHTLVFDKGHFRKTFKSHGGLTPKAQEILAKPFIMRTDDDVFFLRIVVDRLKSFDKYNRRVKNKLAKVIQYEAFDHGRVVVRQGHIGRSLYFIIKGRVLVKMADEANPHSDQGIIVGELREGMSFGELALQADIRRAASIICNGYSEFLKVDKDDYEDVLIKCYQEELEAKKEIMDELPAFAGWSEDEKRYMAKITKLKEYGKDELIYGNRYVKEPENMYFLVRGKVKLLRSVVMAKHVDIHGVAHYELLSNKLKKGYATSQITSSWNKEGRKLRRLAETGVIMKETFYWSAATLSAGFYFSVGENFKHFYIMSKSFCEFLVVPRFAFIKYSFPRTLPKLVEDLEDSLPSELTVYNIFTKRAQWNEFKQSTVVDLLKKSKRLPKTKISDVPKAIQDEYSHFTALRGAPLYKSIPQDTCSRMENF